MANPNNNPEQFFDRVSIPDVRGYGNTFAEFESANELGAGRGPISDAGGTKGNINRDNLNKNVLDGSVEFTKFEETVKDYVLAKLGHPVVRVELAPLQLKVCIDEAITRLYHHAPLFTIQMAVFRTQNGVNLYKLPMSIMDNLEYVVYKKTLLSIQSQAGTLEFDFFIKYFQDNFLFQNFGVGDFFLLQQHLEQLRKILGQEGS